MKCQVCQSRRQRRTLSEILVPITFVLNYQTGTTATFPAGTLVCDLERRKLYTSTSEGQAIRWHDGRWYRADGKQVM
jgi:hypothetical protein